MATPPAPPPTCASAWATTCRRCSACCWVDEGSPAWRAQAVALLRERPEWLRIERRRGDLSIETIITSAGWPGQFATIPREAMSIDAEIACATARRFSAPAYSRSYFLPNGSGTGAEVVDLCVPLPTELGGERAGGALVATLALGELLQAALPPTLMRRHEVLLVEADGTRLARAGVQRGAGAFIADRLVDLSGFTMLLRLDSLTGAPHLIPNRTAALAGVLSLALGVVIVLLVHDMRRRSAAEQALAEALAFRQAMENSLVTGLRARTTDGRITYVNPAFCRMVGFSADELLGRGAALLAARDGRDLHARQPSATPAARRRARATRRCSCAAAASASRC